MTPFESRFANELHAKIAEELTNKHRHLAEGNSLIREDAAASGMNTARMVGEISGLKSALEFMKHVEQDLTGKKGD